MNPVYDRFGVRVFEGDCLHIMRTLPDESVDSVVTDPPAGIQFMGKSWDSNRGGRDRWIEWLTERMAEALRVLKPGGHALVWALPRTSHWTALALEDAGFEIRDCVTHLFGTGFPKSLDVSAAIDKSRDDTDQVRVVSRFLRARIDEHATESVRSLAIRFGFHPRMIEHWAARDTDSQPTLPTLEQWDVLRSALGFPPELDAEVLRLNLRKGGPGEVWADRPVTGQVIEWTNRTNYALTSRDGFRRDRPASDDARQWSGWGTALKPASEHWWLIRKPLIGTVAGTVLEHGTGALNIDACRVGMSDADRFVVDNRSGTSSRRYEDWGTRGDYAAGRRFTSDSAGRWPPNVVLSHGVLLDPVSGEPVGDACADGCVEGCPVAELDRQSGIQRDGVAVQRNGGGQRIFKQGTGLIRADEGYGGEGGASRFFPCFRWEAKAPPGERPRVNGAVHPTVKPVALMRWLVRLVTPPGGTVLDCFAGTGPTGQAARAEGFRSILIESDPLSIPLIRARLDAHPKTEAAAAGFPVVEPEQDLFDLLNNA